MSSEIKNKMFNKNKMMRWIGKSLETDTFSIEDQGKSAKGDGYIGDVHFVKVILNDPKRKEKELFLVVKASKTDTKIRDFSLTLFRIEVTFYSEILPILNKFQQEKNVKFPFKSIPICYKAFIEKNNEEVIIMENLRTRGYEMLHNSQPLNLNHIKLVFKKFAKFHAISFALLDQEKDLFKQMEEKYKYSLKNVIESFELMYGKLTDKAVNYLIEAGQKDLAQKLGKLKEKGFYNVIKSSIDDLPEERVVIHGDCYTQNLLFKYQDENLDDPSAVAFIDFQLSGIYSPITDLAHFWYRSASSAEVVPHFKELMEFYYKELSSSVDELGSDISKTFPISKMWNHWEKYSFYGFITPLIMLDLSYSEEVIDFADMLNGKTGEVAVKMNDKNKSAFLERLVSMTDHYFNFKIN